MRISPICISPAKNYQNCNVVRRQNLQSNPNFKGWGGALGTIGGALVGVGLTAISGGALAWTIPALGGTGTICGDIYEHQNKSSNNNYDDDDYDYEAYCPNRNE